MIEQKSTPDIIESMFLLDSDGLVGFIFDHEKYHFLLELLSFISVITSQVGKEN